MGNVRSHVKCRCVRLVVLAATILFAVHPITADETRRGSLGLSIAPAIAFSVQDTEDYYEALAYGGNLTAFLTPGKFPWLSPRFDVAYTYVPTNLAAAPTTLSLLSGSLGVQGSLTFGERFSVFAYGRAGGYFGLLTGGLEETGAMASLHGGGGVGFQLIDDVSITASAAFDAFLGTAYSVSVFLGVSTRLAGPGGGAVPLRAVTPLRPGQLPASGMIRVSDVRIEKAFPVLLKYYDVHPIGTVAVTNVGEEALTNVEVRVRPSSYADSAKLSARIPELAPGDSAVVDLFVVFSEQILGVTEGARIVADIEVSYRQGDREGSDVETVTLETYDRNAMQWDDDRKIAAFVTAKDEEIQRFARNTASFIQESTIEAISSELQLAMMQFCALTEQELTYLVDPSSAYEDFSENPFSVDFVQFPRQTLYVRAGDCDDLSSAYCALLESIGISTAFVTVPGHIYTAFKLNMNASEAIRSVANSDSLIVRPDDSVWVPVETTLLDQGFLEAWAAGARQWAANEPSGDAGFHRVSEAWQVYEPVAFSVSQIELEMPPREPVIARFRAELDRFVEQRIYTREQPLLARLESRPNDPRTRNSLGVLYARYGKLDEARRTFESIVDQREHAPSLLNLANIHFLDGNYGTAGDYYERVLQQSPEHPGALLGFARVEYEHQNFDTAREAFNQLRDAAPELAAEYAYLDPTSEADSTARANDATRLQSRVEWEEEE